MGKKLDTSWLVSASLNDPDERLGRRKRARQKADLREKLSVELPAEKAPRSSKQWIDDERKRTKLPTAQDAEEYGPQGPQGPQDRAPAAKGNLEDGVGKKKARRLAVLEAKKAQKEQQKVAKDRKAWEGAGAEKVKKSDCSAAAAEMLSRCHKSAKHQQRLLAIVAERVAGDPNKDLEIFDVFFEVHRMGADERTRQLAILSAVVVFKDLVPGYRIREPTEAEKQMTRSRGVLDTEKYEMGLLQTYKKLLPTLEAAVKRDPRTFAPALAALVKTAYDFNYRQRLITTAVKAANSSQPAVRKVMADALREMVAADTRLDACKEVVAAVGRLAQGAAHFARSGPTGGGLQCDIFQVLLHLPVGLSEAAALKDRGGGDIVDADDETKRNLAEASITGSVDTLRKAEAELLYEVFVVYLRVLRQHHVHGRDQLAAALVGLARWGQQVNLELLLDILNELRFVVEDAVSKADELVALQGLNCALVLLSGPSQALMTDHTWIADAVTAALGLALPSLHCVSSESPSWPPPGSYATEGRRLLASGKEIKSALDLESVPALVLRCLDSALKCPQGYGRASDAAIAVLLEKLFLLAAAADAHVGLAILREASTLLRKSRKLHTMLDTEGGLFGLGGITERSVSVAWPLQLMSFCCSPAAAKAAEELPPAIRSRFALLGELFPAQDAQSWLATEVPRHLGALASAPAPKPPQGGSRRAVARARFLTPGDLEVLWRGVPGHSTA